MDEPRDSATFRMAVAGLGLSLAIALTGICVILAFGSGEIVRTGSHSAIKRDRHQGIPDKHRRANNHSHSHSHAYSRTRDVPPTIPPELWLIVAGLFGALVGVLLPAPHRKAGIFEPIGLGCFVLAVVILAVLALTGDIELSVPLQGALAAGGAALVALLIPTPARYDPR